MPKKIKLYKVTGTSFAFARKRDAQSIAKKLNKTAGGKKNRVVRIIRNG